MSPPNLEASIDALDNALQNAADAATPDATPSAAAAAASAPSTARTESVPGLEHEFQELANQSRGAAFLRAAVRRILEFRQHVGYCIQGRCGSETLADRANADALTPDETTALQQTLKQVLLASQGELAVQLSGPHAAGQRTYYAIAIPVESVAAELHANFCFAVMPSTRNELDLFRAELTADVLAAAARLPHATGAAVATPSDPAVEMLGRFAQYRNTREFAFALVNSLAVRRQCEQAVIGLRQGDRIEVVAISGMETIKASNPGVASARQAMEECLDAGATLASSGEARGPLHSQWAQSTQSQVCSIPVQAGTETVAIVSLRWRDEYEITADVLKQIEDQVSPFGAAIELAQRGERTVAQQLRSSAKSALGEAMRPRTRKGLAVRIALTVAIAVALLGWMPYSPTSPCVIVPGSLRQTHAAFEMELVESLVHSGDAVRQGQVLARFDTRALELERDSLRSKRDQAQVDVRAALLRGDAGAASLAKASSDVFQSDLEAVNQKIAMCTLRAPQDGMVVDADLQQHVGRLFAPGEPILSFAPMDEFELEIRLPESESRHIQPMQTGEFVTAAAPDAKTRYTIESVDGAAQLIEGKNVIVARAKLADASDQFRQGVRGYARTTTGWRPIPWVLFHRIFDYARTHFWI